MNTKVVKYAIANACKLVFGGLYLLICVGGIVGLVALAISEPKVGLFMLASLVATALLVFVIVQLRNWLDDYEGDYRHWRHKRQEKKHARTGSRRGRK